MNQSHTDAGHSLLVNYLHDTPADEEEMLDMELLALGV